MASPKASMTVAQTYNGRYNAGRDEDPADNPKQLYRVEKTVNTLVEEIGAYLTPAKVQELIDQGVNMTVQPVK